VQALKGAVTRDEELLKEALARAESCRDPLDHAFVMDRYGSYLGASGRWDEALTQYRNSCAIYAGQGARVQQAMSINYGSRCYSARAGRLAESLRYACEFREIATEMGTTELLAARAMEAEPYLYQGAWNDVIRVVEESLPIAWQIGETAPILFGSAWLGLAYLKVDRLAEARRVIDRAIAHWQVGRDATPFSLTYVTIAAALTRLAAGETETALETARRALDYADRSRFRLEQGAAHRVLGQAYAATGNSAEADAAFRESLGILESISSWPELGQTLLAYGQFKMRGDQASGRALVERARATFDQIGAAGWVVEAQAALDG
jgi:tetratricopeptide (TPR) repeat protein